MIPLPETLGRDLLAQVTGRTPRVMVRLKRYLDQISASRDVVVGDVYSWVLRYSEEQFAELCKFADNKLVTARDQESFKRFLRWFLEPSSTDRPVPEGSFLQVLIDSS